MSTRQRAQHVTVNFDGLTDAVTNLTGVLILVVVLVMGITTEIRPGQHAQPMVEPTIAEDSIESMLNRVQMLRLRIQAIDESVKRYEEELPELGRRINLLQEMQAEPNLPGDENPVEQGGFVDAGMMRLGLPEALLIRALAMTGIDEEELSESANSESLRSRDSLSQPEQEAIMFLEEGIRQSTVELEGLKSRMPELRKQMERLLEQVETIRPPDEAESAPEPPVADRQVNYRPPLERRSRQNTLIFCCRENNIRYIEVNPEYFQVAEKRVGEALKQKRGSGGGVQPLDFELPGTELRCRGFFQNRLGQAGYTAQWALVLSAELASRGEAAAQTTAKNSQFRRVLTSHRPGQSCVNFAVWPDSYQAFLKARSVAWDAGFDVGWYPMDSGEPLQIQPGLSLVD